jgi:KaiC/GvpD/RAD55 family RecA-like ATPase/tetratricopeptide (TPR) repeat protein
VAERLKTGVLAEPVLVGRDKELKELESFLNSAVEGKGHTVLISGEAGSGKTRLTHEFLDMVKEKGIVVLSSGCLSDVAVPYIPFTEAFSAYFAASRSREKEPTSPQQPRSHAEPADDEEAEIKAWLSGPKQAVKTEKTQNLTPQAWQDLAVAAITKIFLAISTRETVVLFIDDLQWADSASLSLLHYVSRSIGSARVLVLATYRSEELGPDAEGHPHPLLETIHMMRRENLLREIKLSSLDQASVAVLAEKMVGGGLHPELADRLAEESQGNPLFIVESLRMLSESGSLVQDSGLWRLSIDEVGIPTKIKDIILRRVSMLKPNQRRVLDLASVIGERFDVELLGAVLGQDSLEVLETLNAIGQSSSLVLCEGSFYEFDHAKSRDAIYEEIPTLLRKGYHARIADKMEARNKEVKNLPVNDLAYHYARAGNREKAVEYSLAAGEDALARFSNSEAARQFTYVLSTVTETSEYAAERTIALEGLGDALSANGLYMEATKKFVEVSSSAESGAVKLRALRKAVLCSFWMNDRIHALELARKAEEYAQFDRLEYARLRVYKGFVGGRMGKSKEAFEDLEGALSVFEEEFSLRDVASALVESVFLYMDEDRVEDEFAAGLRSLALYEELEDFRGQMLAHDFLMVCFGTVGLFQESEYNGEETIKIAEKIGDYNIMAMCFANRARNRESARDLRGAVALNLKGAEYAERTEAYFALTNCYTNLVKEYSMLGEIKQAEKFAKKIDNLFDKMIHLGSNLSLVGMVQYVKAHLLLAKGQWKEANDIFEKSHADGQFGSEFSARFKDSYAWALTKQGRNEEAKMQLEEAKKMRQKLAEKLERLEHANIQAYLLAHGEIGVGEEFTLRLDLVNVSKNPTKIVRVERLIPNGFRVIAPPPRFSVQDSSLEMNQMKINPFKVEAVNLSLEATLAGDFTLDPRVVYIDDKGETKICKPRSVTLTVRPMVHARIGEETISVPILPNRLATGYTDLDVLLFGGLPKNYAVILASPPSDERETLIETFLETGTKTGETTFYITAEAGNTKTLAEKYPSSFFLFLCNPQAESMAENLPNVTKLKGIENLTNIDIALTKNFRALNATSINPKRICIEIISDALLQHKAIITRRWLSALLPTLKSKGFTTLAVVDPQMHPPEELQAILSVFDGEMRANETETTQGTRQILKIRRLRNQKYLEKQIILPTNAS